MTFEGTGKCEFAKFVSYHILGNIYRNMLSSVVNCDGVTNEFREDSGGTGPGLKHLFLILFIHSTDTVEEFLFDVGCLL